MKYLFVILLLSLTIILVCLISSVETRESMESQNADIEIVVSRYNENLEWLKEEPFNKYPIICYNKGPNEEFYKPNGMKIVTVENVGRCDHTYIYHIVNNYDNLSKHIMFLPGSCNMPNKMNKARRWLSEIERTDQPVFIGLQTQEGIQSELKDFQLDDWAASDEKNRVLNPESKLKLSSIRPFGKWFQKFFKDVKAKYYTLGGILGVGKENVMQHPKSYYEDLLQELNDHSNPEVGHYFERSWAAIFHPTDKVTFINELG